MSTTITSSGNLGGAVTLRTADDGTIYGSVTVIHNDRYKDADTGQWKDGVATPYRLSLSGARATRLANLQQRAGNVNVIFTGRLKRRAYTDNNGNPQVSNDVRVDEIGVNVAIHDLDIHQETDPTIPNEDYTPNGDIDSFEGAPTGYATENPWPQTTPLGN